MKKPDDTKRPKKTTAARDATPRTPTKTAAEPGVIAVTDIGAGDGAAAAATGGEIKPVESTLLGDPAGQHPPAERKGQAPADTPAPKPAIAAAEAGPSPAAKPSTPAAPPAPPVVVKKTGFWPVVLGGAVAAALGSAATIWALPHLPAGWLPAMAVNQTSAPAEPGAPAIDVEAIRAEAVSAAEAAAAQQVEALRTELAARPEAPAPQEPAPQDAAAAPQEPAAPVISAEDLAALRQQIDQQAQQIRELSERPQIDPALAERVETLAEQAGTLEQQIQTAAQAAQAQINEAQAEAERLQQAAAEGTRRAEALAAIAALQTALDRGVTPDEARQTLEGAGIETPEALTREVPSLDKLQADFPEAARAALRTALRDQSAAGNGNLLTNFLRAQTGARSVEVREGADPDAVLSRANAAVEAGRIAEAVTEVETLPEDARATPAMAAWLAGAVAYRDAQAALSDLSAPAN